MIDLLIIWRVYLFIVVLLAANSVSRLFFNPTEKMMDRTFKSLGFVFLWPLAMVSPEGRKILFNTKL